VQQGRQPTGGDTASERRLNEQSKEGVVFGSNGQDADPTAIFSFFDAVDFDLATPPRHLSDGNESDPSDDDEIEGRDIGNNETTMSTTSTVQDDALFDGAVTTGRSVALFTACVVVAISRLPV